MTKDRKIVYFLSALIFAALLSCLFIPVEASSRVVAAAALVLGCLATVYFIKKRITPSVNKRTVLLIITVSALLYVVLLYLSGLKFGFYRSRGLNIASFFKNILPIILIIISTEIIRNVILAQKLRFASVLIYLACVCADVLIHSKLTGIERYVDFMEIVGLYFLPAFTANLLYAYLSRRYGIYPIITFKLITVIYSHIFTKIPAIPESMHSFIKLIFPLLLIVFIDALFEKKKRFALKKKSKFGVITYGIIFAFMISTVMIISCQFRFGMLVIATESMTGEINKGDAIIYESFESDDKISVGDVIVFEKMSSKTVHRVIKLENINGTTRYYTKGDANEDADFGYITDSSVIGKVKFKISYFGYPSLWLRELFENKQ